MILGLLQIVPGSSIKGIKQITEYLNNGSIKLFAGYELLTYKKFHLDFGLGIDSLTTGISRDIFKSISVGGYISDTYKNILDNNIELKYGIGIGVKF